MPNRLLVAAAFVSVLAPRLATGQPASDWLYTQAGGLIGGAVMIGLTRASVAACGVGCENDMPAGAELMLAGIGAGIGSLAGYAADRLRGDTDPVFSVRAGPVFNHMTMRSSLVHGAANGAGAMAVLQLSRYVTVHGEYTRMTGSFAARPGSIDPNVLANLVPATTRVAGRTRGVERSHVTSVFSELIGVHLPFGRHMQVGLLGGIAVQASETFSYYDAHVSGGEGTSEDPMWTSAVPGKFYLLNFASPDVGAVFGGSVDIFLSRQVAIVPMIRYYRGRDPGPAVSYAVGALYRF
jgi:hypothetical protein